MPLPSSLARFNKRFANHLTRPAAARLPGFGVVRHRGRKTGRTYSTPVNMYRSPGGYVIALPYGSARDWVKNVLHFGGCELETRSQIVAVTDPRVVNDASLRVIPSSVRPLLKALGVTEVLELRAR